jgi:hypothetical protein
MINDLEKVDFLATVITSIPGPDLYDFGPPGSGSFYHHHPAKTVRIALISTVL